MALFQIGNDKLTIQVDSMGAELKSLKKTDTGEEFMWEGNPLYWKRTSPILFPLVGSLKGGAFLHNGRQYPMGQHGFARDMEFKLKSQTNRAIWFALTSTEETLAKYPYEFLLEIGYELMENTLVVKWKVENPSDQTMHFSIGGHPAFRCPITDGAKQADYRIRLDRKESFLSGGVQNGLMSGKKIECPLEDGCMWITKNLFDIDTFVIEDDQVHQVSLVKPDGTAYVTVDFDAPIVGIWSPPGKEAPFVCIEPWYGRCDAIDFDGTWEERAWGQRLEARDVFEASYRVQV